MLPLETKQSGGKLLPHSDLPGGSVSRGGSRQARQQDCMDPAQDRERWRALVSAVMNLRVP